MGKTYFASPPTTSSFFTPPSTTQNILVLSFAALFCLILESQREALYSISITHITYLRSPQIFSEKLELLFYLISEAGDKYVVSFIMFLAVHVME